MKLGKLAILTAVLTVALVSGWSSPGEAITLPACTDIICAFDGDFAVMSLPFAGVKVPSSPGQIQDGVVVYTGSSGGPVTTNFSGMDNAYPSVSGACPPNCTFSTTTTADPGGVGEFGGDASGTWDSTLAAFITFLDGSAPLFFFNQNDTNSDSTLFTCPGSTSNQDVCVYGMLTLVDNEGPDRVFELEAPTRLFSEGPGTTDGVADLPSEYVLAKGDVCLDINGAQVDCDSPDVAFGPENHNLGANEAAYVGFSTVLNGILAACAQFGVNTAQCPYDSLSIRLDLADLNNGFEQLFILTGDQLTQIPPVPVPGSLILIGAGLMGLGASAWRRRPRG
jgi:hypothetical protein